ncbi:alpha/beta hydrolase fold domain-containing protein [Amycolatopsis thermophila]|uniref:Acetyl esterase/lipase n=1 Tax=Amycolatopsis thermophila TaxID=206084 RepID=A0ABU0F5W5_9PSEU|nr:alpha/beta hydrolase fold domain-containing protein [Amycolatopsis thermophila]MDQ0382982.1 acetyl esterase/lipase [Amycolatopsis thermophila]
MPGRVSLPLTAGTDAFPAPMPRRGTADELVHESLCYRVIDGHRPLFLDLHVPRPARSGELAPVVVWVHGGGWLAGSRRRFPVGLEEAHLLERVLVAGFAVARVDYRLLAEAAFPAAVDDVCTAVDWLGSHAGEFGLDHARMAIWGESAGAHLALLAAARPATGKRLRALVDWYGPTDLTELAGSVAGGGSGGEDAGADLGGLLERGGWDVPEASPLHATTAAMPPALIVHGHADELVTPDHSTRLRDCLTDLAVPVEYVETDGGHVFAGSGAAVPMIRHTIGFLGRQLDFAPGPHPDEELEQALTAIDAPIDPMRTDDPDEARRLSREFMAQVQPHRDLPVVSIEDTTIPVGEQTVGLRIQRPARPTDVAFLYVHGGGWVVGDLDTHQAQAARIAAALPAVSVQVDYRRAPEHPFPAAHEDVLGAVLWLHEHLAELGCSRLVLVGDSAGGHLVLATAQTCRDRGVPIAAVLVNYPATDFRSPAIQGLPLTLLGGRDELREDPRVSPVLGDLSGLPPTVIGVGARDFLYEDVLTFAQRLRAAGTETKLRIFPTLQHGYFSTASLSVACDRAAETVCRDLSELLWDARRVH